MSGLSNCKFVSYADDSYVINSGDDINSVKENARRNIQKHSEELSRIGMVVNNSKTELVLFHKDTKSVDVVLDDGTQLSSTHKLKALGVWIDNRLKWNVHIEELKRKVTRIISGLKIIRRKLSFKQTLNVVTAQVFSILYYASPAWLTPAIGRAEMDNIERIHFKALRVVTKDFKQRQSRSSISTRTNRLPPRLWSTFASASVLMKTWHSGIPVSLRRSFFENTYSTRRYPGLLSGFDSSRHKVSKQSTNNWCGGVLSQVKVPWTNRTLTNDQIRTILKATIYPPDFLAFSF